MTQEMKFKVGDRAEKVGGSYQATGTVVAAFRTLNDYERYVFELDTPAGLLHIFGTQNLEPIKGIEFVAEGL